MYEKVASIVGRLPDMEKHILMGVLGVQVPDQVDKVAKIAASLSEEEKNKLFGEAQEAKPEYSDKKGGEGGEGPDHIMKLKAIMGKLPDDQRALILS